MLSKIEHWGDSDHFARSVNHYIDVRPRLLAVVVSVAVNGVLPDRNKLPVGPGAWLFRIFNIGTKQYTIRAADFVLVGVILPGFTGYVSLTEDSAGERYWHMVTRQIRGGPPPYHTTPGSSSSSASATPPATGTGTGITASQPDTGY